MVASRILGREAFGLGAILEAEFGVHLEKRFQRANWGERPLPAHLQAYARLDTHYLIGLRNRLRAELVASSLWPLAQEDFSRLTGINGNGRAPDERSMDCWRISGSYDLTPQQAAILHELCAYRDKVARMLNRPLFKVLNDKTLIDLAISAPHDREGLSLVQGMTHGQIERHATGLLEAIQRGEVAEPVYPPRPPKPDEQFLDRLESLRRWRKATAEQMGVKSDVVLPRDLLYALAEHNPNCDEELAQVMSGVPWRLERFGSEILAILTT
jgi:ribonuclease D